MNRTTTAVVLALGAAALLALGCSSTSAKNDYVDTVNEIQTSALNAFNQAASSTPRSKGALVEQLEAGEEALSEAVAELEAVEVPQEAEGGHPKLVKGVDDLRDLFARTATEVRRSEGTETLQAVNGLGSEGAVIGTEIDEAIDQINRDLGAS